MNNAMLLAFDYGEKRIGVAIGNTLTHCARVLTIIANRNRVYRFAATAKLISEWQPKILVVGRPTYPDGTPHRITKQAERFGHQLNSRFSLPVAWVDERYSSCAASVDHSAFVDAEAARIILQQFLDQVSSARGRWANNF